jgi:pyridoxal phosphate enzyme (YggS family)
MTGVEERLVATREAIVAAARRARRDPAEIELLAVSKTHPPEALREAIEAGQRLFGESRVQEARAKIPLLPSRTRWHFIGHLQSNKIRHALASEFELLHGIDTLELAVDLDRIAGELGHHPRLLLEVNLAGESTKFGFSPAKLRAAMPQLLGFERLQIERLRTIAPIGRDAEDSRRYFGLLRELRDQLQGEFGVRLAQLSMGMSGDFPVAIEEGATIVRIGSAIFGRRSGKSWRPSPDRATLGD